MSKVKIVNCCEVAKTERLQESNRMINDKKFVKNTFSVFTRKFQVVSLKLIIIIDITVLITSF